jgi:cell division septal protein FtsQ
VEIIIIIIIMLLLLLLLLVVVVVVVVVVFLPYMTKRSTRAIGTRKITPKRIRQF